MPALDIDQHVGIEEVHRLRPRPSLRFFSQNASVCRSVSNVPPRADEPFAPPVRNKFRARAQGGLRAPTAREEAKCVLRQRNTESSGFGDEFAFQFRRKVKDESHVDFTGEVIPRQL